MDIPVALPKTSVTSTRKRVRVKTIHSFKKSAITNGDVNTLPVLQDKYKYEIEQLGWIMLNPTNTNQINSYQIDLANLHRSLRLKYMSDISSDDIKLMMTHIKIIIDFVTNYFKTGFTAF